MSFELIARIVQDLNAGGSFREIFESVYNHLHDAIPCNRLSVALYDASTDRLTLHACRSDGEILLGEGFRAQLKGSSIEPILKSGIPRILNDLEAELREGPESESNRLVFEEGMRSSLTVPLIARGRPIGVLFFCSRRAGAYTREHADLSGLVTGHISVALERSLLTQEIRSSNEYLQNILENSADAILVIAPDRRILSWNRGAQRMFGWRSDEILGKGLELLVPPDLLARGELKWIEEAVARDGFIAAYETVRMDRDGRPLTVSMTSSVIRDRSGRIVARSAIIRDLTHLKRLQDDLIRTRSLAAVGELAATVAHEIRNPLAGISGAIQVVADSLSHDDRCRHVFDEVLAQVKRLDDTVRDLLIFARPWKPDLRPVDLVEIIDQTAGALQQEPRMERIRIRRETPVALPVTADPHLLQEVLLNLFLNSADAMACGGLVRIVGREDNGHVNLRVIDQGTGIPVELQPRLFSPFFTTKARGTGLGLAVSKKIIEAHEGRIEIESMPGQGTEVAITLKKEPRNGAPGPDR